MKSKFYKLFNYFENVSENEITLTYSQIEDISGEKLPPSVYKHSAYLSNDKNHSIAKSWLNNDFKVVNNDIKNQIISFTRQENLKLTTIKRNYEINLAHKQNIVSVITIIADEILKDQDEGAYNTQRMSIEKIFKQSSGSCYNRQGIELRLIVIDSLYSTNMSKRYFAFEELSEAILSLGNTELDVINEVISFRDKPNKDSKLYEIFENKKYGIHKNGKSAGEAKSLLSKYLYFQMMFAKNDLVGFPIYDSLAKTMYKPVWNYLGREKIKNFKNKDIDIIDYINSFKELKEVLEIDQIKTLQCFDLLDAYLWRMGKFTEANFSLLLNKTDYLKLISGFKLVEYGKNKKSEKLNKILKTRMKKQFHTILDNPYFNSLWKHWLLLDT